MEPNKLLLEKIHELIERKNKPPPKLKPHQIFDGIKKAKPLPVKKKKRKPLRKVQSTKK
jgi:hypothetical protein